VAPIENSLSHAGPPAVREPGLVLDDGVYDVFVVDAAADGTAALRLDLTILAGAHKGQMVAMRAEGLGVDEIDALGMPGTLTVADGEPSVVLDR
jgi:hypothetical protein